RSDAGLSVRLLPDLCRPFAEGRAGSAGGAGAAGRKRRAPVARRPAVPLTAAMGAGVLAARSLRRCPERRAASAVRAAPRARGEVDGRASRRDRAALLRRRILDRAERSRQAAAELAPAASAGGRRLSIVRRFAELRADRNAACLERRDDL